MSGSVQVPRATLAEALAALQGAVYTVHRGDEMLDVSYGWCRECGRSVSIGDHASGCADGALLARLQAMLDTEGAETADAMEQRPASNPEASRLRDALRKYGSHAPTCSGYRWIEDAISYERTRVYDGPCGCGFMAALSAAPGSPRGAGSTGGE